MCGSDAWSYSHWILCSLEAGWDWEQCWLPNATPHPSVGQSLGTHTRPAQGHVLAHHKQAALSSTAACGETKSPFGDARMKEAFYKDFRVCSPSGLYVFFQQTKLFQNFSNQLKEKLVWVQFLVPSSCTHLSSQRKTKVKERMVSLKFSLNFNWL